MASTLPLPLMSIVDSSHYVRGHGHSHSHQPHRSRKAPQRSPLSRIPSERLDPRWINSNNYNDTVEPPNRNWDDKRHASMDRIVLPSSQDYTVPSPRNDTFVFPKRTEAVTQDNTFESSHYAYPDEYHHHVTEKAEMPVTRMEDKTR